VADGATLAQSQEPVSNPAKKAPEQTQAQKEQPASKPELPFQIQLLETHIRFETNGDSGKEVHTIVKINNVLGARQFARLTFDYNRAFQQVEIPLVRVSHANGGISEVLPSAVVDGPNPAVEKFSAYQDVRVKSVRVLGLVEGDTIEYRVITTTTHHPLAPDFWLEHSFDRSGQVLEDDYELDLPGKLNSTTTIGQAGGTVENPGVYVAVPWSDYRNAQEGKTARSLFTWKLTPTQIAPAQLSKSGGVLPDILVTTFSGWGQIVGRLASQLPTWSKEDARTAELQLRAMKTPAVTANQRLHASYDLASHKVATIDLPREAIGFRIRLGKEILETGYATPEEKCYLLAQLAKMAGFSAEIVFSGEADLEYQAARPAALQHVFVLINNEGKSTALDPSTEVAPFGLIPAQIRGKRAMSLSPHDAGDYVYNWLNVPEKLPFPERQEVNVSADLSDDGKLMAKVKYTMRGDNELLLRVAFHQTPKDKWKEVAGLLALSDGFRGQVTSIEASDPVDTKGPFKVEYELAQPKFVDWSKTPVRIPALLPQIGLPELPPKSQINPVVPRFDLGTPLEVQTDMTLHLPSGTQAQSPAGTKVDRDYAKFESKYSATQNTLSASRHIRFLSEVLFNDQVQDYSAFLRAVQNDQAQRFVVVPAQP